MCKIPSPCPYGHQCQDCLHYEPGQKRKYRKTGIPTDNIRAYKREYTRRQRVRQSTEMECQEVEP